MADKIDVARLAREANKLAVPHIGSGMFHAIRDEHFARLVMEECARVVESTSPIHTGAAKIAALIRARMP